MASISSNFDILISPADGQSRYPVRVIDSPAGQSREPSCGVSTCAGTA